ncbi:MAG: hypothetical protein ACLVCH_00455 [Roseburia inulinivorans]
MAEEELPEIAMPEGLDDIDNQWEDEDFESWMQKFHRKNAASRCRTHSRADQTGSVSRSGRHNGGRHICGRCGSRLF